jgi:16S rRNA (guanine1207-N2)-methyltransferase
LDPARFPAVADDAALAALLLPFADADLRWPASGRVLFLRARAGAGLPPGSEAWVCEQSFRPHADRLQAAGLRAVAVAEGGDYDLVLVLPPRQRQEARALLARALSLAADGAPVVASALNTEGARSVEADLFALAGPGQTRSKHKCRVCWVRRERGRLDAGLLAQWQALDAPQPIADGRFLSRPGLFAWDRIDVASALLAASLPSDLQGAGADLGAGFGYLAAEVLARCPGVRALDLYEAEARALDLARRNLAGSADPRPLRFLWQDVSQGLAGRYDFIVSNPPFHQGRADQPDLGRAFIAAAAAALVPGGRLWLVANSHLPYEAALAQGFARVRVVRVEHGFKVIEAIKANP